MTTKVCKGCQQERPKSLFSEYQWKVGQRFCLVDQCKAVNDGRSLRMKAFNKNSQRQREKGRKREIGNRNVFHNAIFNQNSDRQRKKGQKGGVGERNGSFNGNSERQRTKGQKRRLDLDNIVHNVADMAADKHTWLADPVRAHRNSVFKQKAG